MQSICVKFNELQVKKGHCRSCQKARVLVWDFGIFRSLCYSYLCSQKIVWIVTFFVCTMLECRWKMFFQSQRCSFWKWINRWMSSYLNVVLGDGPSLKMSNSSALLISFHTVRGWAVFSCHALPPLSFCLWASGLSALTFAYIWYFLLVTGKLLKQKIGTS